MGLLDEKRGLVVGIANEHSIASGCARAFHREGAELAVTYLNERARPFLQPVAEALDAEIFMPLDVTADADMDALFEAIASSWGQPDFVLHSVAYCPKEDLHGNVVDCSREGFGAAMDISVHSFTPAVCRQGARYPSAAVGQFGAIVKARGAHRSGGLVQYAGR
ncbi:SDR family oxidoreductase [Tritonibacter litoralis]|uniref:SDR family oxidoreductase n=1 Tax=Tritonibacter litoralis TaxID=2662264 RepID=UPI001FE8C5D7|nr:SDR family oxidoreductase [Tritonibacter litoralis]